MVKLDRAFEVVLELARHQMSYWGETEESYKEWEESCRIVREYFMDHDLPGEEQVEFKRTVKWVCPECGSDEVQAAIWTDCNTGEQFEETDNNYYCVKCDDTSKHLDEVKIEGGNQC